MKRFLLLLSLPFSGLSVMACDACEIAQPRSLRGITHGAGPDSGWDYMIVLAMVAITLYVLAATLRCLFRPSEKSEQHIKRMILNDSNV
jgi:hypothetical protein